jgi:hypothetical protein
MSYTFAIWWDEYTPAVEAQVIKDLMLLRTYTPELYVRIDCEIPESLQSAINMLRTPFVSKEQPCTESKSYITKESTQPPSEYDLSQDFFAKNTSVQFTGPGKPIVVDPPKVVPAPPQLSPNHKPQPPRTPCTILPPWLTN